MISKQSLVAAGIIGFIVVLAFYQQFGGVVVNVVSGITQVLDLADDGSNESALLSEIATTGDTNSIFTEPTADKLLIAVGNDWPKADLADALANNPTDCAANQFANAIVASGNLTCAQVAFSDLSGSAADSQVPDTITIALAATATALAADPADCAADTKADAIAASGALTCSAVDTGDIANGTILDLDLNADVPSNGECLTYLATGSGVFRWATCGTGGTFYQTVQNEGVDVTQRTILDFAGAGVDCVDSAGTKTLCTIAGGSANSFETMNVATGTDPVADSATDTLNLLDSPTVAVTGNAANDQLQWNVIQHAGTNILADLEEEGQINATVVTGNAVDDAVLLGTAASTASWTGVTNCTDTLGQHLNYATVSNSFSCGTSNSGVTFAFTTMDASSGTDPVADTTTDTLIMTGTSPITVTGDSGADSLTFACASCVTSVTGGSGIGSTGGTTPSITTDSTEAGFLTSGALTCGAATGGKMQVHTTPLQYCDNAGTPVLQYAAYGSSTGVATSATALAANGGNCSAGSYALGVDTLAASESCTVAFYQTVENEGSGLTQRTNVNFAGAGVDCVDSGGKTVCTISGGGSTNSFETMDASSGTDPVADSSNDTLVMTGTSPITVTGDSAADSLTFACATCVTAVTGGTGITSSGGTTPAITLDATEINNITWNDGIGTSVWTWDLPSGGPVITFLGSGGPSVDITTGTLKQGGVNVALSNVTLTAGAGLSGGGDISANRTFATASSEADFLLSGALTCGAATQGKAQVHTTPLQYCDNAGTPVLQYAAYGTSVGEATGVVCTSCVDVTDIDQSDSFTWTGAHDFGGATSIEVTNGSNPTIDAIGEVAVDTTDDQFVYQGSSTSRVMTYKKSISFLLESPADVDNFLIKKFSDAMTLLTIDCITDPADSGESVVVLVQERNGTGDSPTTMDSITCDSDGAVETSFTDSGMAATGWMSIDIGTVTGTVTQLVITVEYTLVRE